MSPHSPLSCASCNKVDCHLSFVSRNIAPVEARTAFVVDEVWPEHRDFVAGQIKDGDPLLAPGLFGRKMPRYDWGRGQARATVATLMRHLILHQVAKARGSVRQAAYLEADARLALALSRHLDYRAPHVVVSQAFLPFLWRNGALGGRTFDVLMTRYPLAELHNRLDAVFAQHPDSPTIHDFRAPAAVVQAEAEALAAARHIITPHHDIAEHFPGRAVWLDWRPAKVRDRRPGRRVAFLGPVITRQGAYAVREKARGLPAPLIVFGAELEGPGFWQDVAIERRAMDAAWLDDIAVILHPAAITNAPRKLVEARAHGVEIYAHPSCGLAPGQYRAFETFQPHR
jgi:hypothetical protein